MWNVNKALQNCKKNYLSTIPEVIEFPYVDDMTREKNKQFFEALRQQQDMKIVMQMLMQDDTIFDLHWMSSAEKEKFYQFSQQFVEDAKAFDNTLTNDEIFQALRNQWIIWMLELLFERPLQYHKAMFAYSMLYPYSDNLLDDIRITASEKSDFNQWFTKRLHGEHVKATQPLLLKIDALISMIEQYFPRDEYSDVYEGLYTIQAAQIASLQQHEAVSKSVLDISIQKGGASVIADGYLINGSLSKQEFQFCIDFGFGLQISDDLQDEIEDLHVQHMTLANQCKTKDDRWQLFNKCCSFLQCVIQTYPCSRSDIKSFIGRSCLQLLSSCVLQNEQLYPEQYVDRIRNAIPVQEAYMKETMIELKEKVETQF